MSRRSIKDGNIFHVEVTMFTAALVLGLYVFMMPPNDGDEKMGHGNEADTDPYELLTHVDWKTINLDEKDLPALPMSVAEADNADPTWRFLRYGGPVSFSGVVCEGGYNAAKMVLLEFASLLEGMGKARTTGLCHILRVLTNSWAEAEDVKNTP